MNRSQNDCTIRRRDYRNRTEAIRAVANRDLLHLIVKNEDRDAARFSKSPIALNAKQFKGTKGRPRSPSRPF